MCRGEKTALAFLPVFESLVAEMEIAGMGKSDRDLLLGYLALIPPAHRGDILKDRRAYETADSICTVRGVSTWREAHRVLVRLEQAESSSLALVGAVGGPDGGAAGDQGPGPKKRPRKVKGADPDLAAVAGAGGGETVGVCYEMRDRKTCKFGDACRYSHDPKVLAAARREQQAGLKGGSKGSKAQQFEAGKGAQKPGVCLSRVFAPAPISPTRIIPFSIITLQMPWRWKRVSVAGLYEKSTNFR